MTLCRGEVAFLSSHSWSTAPSEDGEGTFWSGPLGILVWPDLWSHLNQGRWPQQRDVQGGGCPESTRRLLCLLTRCWVLSQVSSASPGPVSWVTRTMCLSLTLLPCKLWETGASSPQFPISCLIVAMEILALCSAFLGLGS